MGNRDIWLFFFFFDQYVPFLLRSLTSLGGSRLLESPTVSLIEGKCYGQTERPLGPCC